MDTSAQEPQRPALRASDAEREQVAAQLQTHFADGRLTYDELQERLQQAYSARTVAELDTLLEDLPSDRKRATGAVPARRPRADRRERRERARYAYISRYIIFCLFLVVIWAASGHHGGFWPIWPIIVFGAFALARLVRSL